MKRKVIAISSSKSFKSNCCNAYSDQNMFDRRDLFYKDFFPRDFLFRQKIHLETDLWPSMIFTSCM